MCLVFLIIFIGCLVNVYIWKWNNFIYLFKHLDYIIIVVIYFSLMETQKSNTWQLNSYVHWFHSYWSLINFLWHGKFFVNRRKWWFKLKLHLLWKEISKLNYAFLLVVIYQRLCKYLYIYLVVTVSNLISKSKSPFIRIMVFVRFINDSISS